AVSIVTSVRCRPPVSIPTGARTWLLRRSGHQGCRRRSWRRKAKSGRAQRASPPRTPRSRRPCGSRLLSFLLLSFLGASSGLAAPARENDPARQEPSRSARAFEGPRAVATVVSTDAEGLVLRLDAPMPVWRETS